MIFEDRFGGFVCRFFFSRRFTEALGKQLSRLAPSRIQGLRRAYRCERELDRLLDRKPHSCAFMNSSIEQVRDLSSRFCRGHTVQAIGQLFEDRTEFLPTSFVLSVLLTANS